METKYISAPQGKKSDYISGVENWDTRYLVSYSFSATGTRRKHFSFSVSACLLFGCSYCHSGQELHALSTFHLITPVLQMEMHSPAATQGPRLPERCLELRGENLLFCRGAGLKRPLKFRAASVFLHQCFQVVKGLALPNVHQSLEDQGSQHQLIPHSALLHCTN